MERPRELPQAGRGGYRQIDLLQDAGLKVSEAAALGWGDVEGVRGGSGRVCLGRWLGRARPGHETEPDSHTDRRWGEAGGVGRGLIWGQPLTVS